VLGWGWRGRARAPVPVVGEGAVGEAPGFLPCEPKAIVDKTLWHTFGNRHHPPSPTENLITASAHPQ
jgi:hypothetical protein